MMRMTLRLLQPVILVAVVVTSWPQITFAQEDEDPPTGVFDPHGNRPMVDISVTTNADGVWIDVHVEYSVPGESSQGSENELVTSGTSAPGEVDEPMQQTSGGTESWYDPVRGYFSRTPDGHVHSLEPVNISNAGQGWVRTGLQEHPDTTPMGFYIDGVFQGIVWVPDEADAANLQWGTPPEVASEVPPEAPIQIDPRDVALDLLSQIPLPDLEIRANPSLGLVGMPSWFWVDGYSGEPFGDSLTVSLSPPTAPEDSEDEAAPNDAVSDSTSFTVEVQVRPSTYEWSFGDGTSLVANSLGKPYPDESDIQHTYEHSSLLFPDGFPVQLKIEFLAEYRVDGGASEELPAILRTYQSTFSVQEMQPVLTGR
jgi:hypothetical protein